MILEAGTKLLVCHRRLFPEDAPRYFLGSVAAYEDGVAKVVGLTWVRDAAHGFQKKADLRTKVISLHTGAVILYELPAEVEIEALRFEQPKGHQIVLRDDAKFHMDLSERIV